ncbi:MAG: aminoglycoside adenylyltransferase domain-containing protein [Gaiellaceae bacterium]
MADPTLYPELNAVLRELVASARTILAENFCGAYLQGSFAVGDADVHSDVDFVVVTHDEVSAQQLAALQTVHKQLYALDVPWAQHLEGSYIPRDSLRRLGPSRPPYLYLDNGSTELVWDNHCNTQVVRWSLREHGVILAGPDPKSLIDPVSADQLHGEVLTAMHEWATWARESQDRFEAAAGQGPAMSRWKQPLLVLSFCRILHTLNSGRVTSKREAGEWALGALDAGWASLVQRALDDRADPWLRVHQPAGAEAVDRTLAFVDYALGEAAARYGADGRPRTLGI